MKNRTLTISLSLLLLPVILCGQEKTITLKQAQILVPRPAFDPVRSLIPGEMESPGDTLETSNPVLKVVLHSDGTWEYAKDPVVASENPVFHSYWNNETIIPYTQALSDLPLKIMLVLSDDASKFCCPYGIKVFSPFGRRHGRNHNGVDIPMPRGSELYAAFDGKVRVSTFHRGFGNVVVIRHENGLETIYGHMSERKVKANDWVKAGDVIGTCGSTGRASGPHLHFETRYEGYAFDPQWIIDFEKGILRHGVYILKRTQFGTQNKYVPESEEEDDEIFRADEEIAEQEAEAAAEAERKAAEEAAAKAAEVWYTIKSGDNLSTIAKRNGVSVSSICKLNNITTKTTLRVGRRIRLK